MLLLYRAHRRTLKGAEADTTNNRMELSAVIYALETLKRPCEIDLYTDSKYVMNGLTKWMTNWKQKGWKTAGRKPVKNQDLWQRLDAACQRHKIHWHWVQGHSGNVGNEEVDRLANLAIDDMQSGSPSW